MATLLVDLSALTKARKTIVSTLVPECVEFLKKGLPNKVMVEIDNSQLTQLYENTTFRCKVYWDTSHLMATCPKKAQQMQEEKKSQLNFSAVEQDEF